MVVAPRPIVFLSDYGLDDEFVGLCHAVMAGISPGSRVIDLTHAIPPQDVLRGAIVLAQAVPFLPRDAVLLAIVDPGVGTARRPVAVEAGEGGALLVGPDNGVLSLAWESLGGPVRASRIDSPDVILQPVSRTFHGRDVFAPAAAHLAAGKTLAVLGEALSPDSLARVHIPEPEVEPGEVHAEVLGVDRYGNLQLSARAGHLEQAGLTGQPELEAVTKAGPTTLPWVATFADVAEGRLAAFVDSGGWVAIVVNRGSAAEAMDLGPGEPVTLRRARTVG
jgi:S-adenosyl-L-methionine hydrolase (adenosine-forming)